MPAMGRGGSSPLPVGFGFIHWGIAGTAATGLRYAPAFSYIALETVEARAQWPVPVNCFLQNLYVHLGVAAVAPFTSTMTVRVLSGSAGVPDQLLNLTINQAAGLEISNTTNRTRVIKGQLVSLEFNSVVGVGTSFNTAQVSCEMVPW